MIWASCPDASLMRCFGHVLPGGGLRADPGLAEETKALFKTAYYTSSTYWFCLIVANLQNAAAVSTQMVHWIGKILQYASNQSTSHTDSHNASDQREIWGSLLKALPPQPKAG